MIALALERFTKNLFSQRTGEQRPVLAVVEDESSQAEYVAERILEHREAGIPLQRQAVLIRTSHHSDLLEVELGRRDIPFVKFGGLKFLEASHVKDVLCVLRWAENPMVKLAEIGLVFLLAVHVFGGLRLLALELLPWSPRQKTHAALATALSFFVSGGFLLSVV